MTTRCFVVTLIVGEVLLVGCESTTTQEVPIFRKSKQLTDDKPTAPGPELYVSLGQLHLRAGKLDDALKSFQRALVLDEDCAKAHALLAATLDRLSRHAEAIAHHDQAVRLSPDEAAVWNNRGYSRLRQGLHQAALADFQKAVALDPANPRYRNNLGLALALAHEPEEALAEFTRAVGPAEAHFNLGCLYYYQGRPAEALRHFRQARELDATLTEADTWLDRLAGPAATSQPGTAKPRSAASQPAAAGS